MKSRNCHHANPEPSALSAMKNGQQVVTFASDVDNNVDNNDSLAFSWYMELEKGDKIRLKTTAGTFSCFKFAACIFNGRLLSASEI